MQTLKQTKESTGPLLNALPTVRQGRNEVYFSIADPIFWPTILIPDTQNVAKADPWSQ